VLPVKLEAGASVVIEVPNLPIPRIVTVFAAAAQLPAMDVVTFVTGRAFDRGFILVKVPFMAAVAHYHSMLAEQGKFCASIVVE
jgi:hypothetical protein